MSFKNFLSENLTVKLPKPHKATINIDLNEYKELILNNRLKSDRKPLIQSIINGGELPIYNEEAKKCYIVDIRQKKCKAREVRSREDKVACGVLINALCIKEDNVEKYQEINWGWDIPHFVWTKK